MKRLILFVIFSSSSVLAQAGKNSITITYEKDSLVGKNHGLICSLTNNTDSSFQYYAFESWRDSNIKTITPNIDYKFLKAGAWVDDDRFICSFMHTKQILHSGESLRFRIGTNDFRDSAKAIRMGIRIYPQTSSYYTDSKMVWSNEIVIR